MDKGILVLACATAGKSHIPTVVQGADGTSREVFDLDRMISILVPDFSWAKWNSASGVFANQHWDSILNKVEEKLEQGAIVLVNTWDKSRARIPDVVFTRTEACFATELRKRGDDITSWGGYELPEREDAIFLEEGIYLADLILDFSVLEQFKWR